LEFHGESTYSSAALGTSVLWFVSDDKPWHNGESCWMTDCATDTTKGLELPLQIRQVIGARAFKAMDAATGDENIDMRRVTELVKCLPDSEGVFVKCVIWDRWHRWCRTGVAILHWPVGCVEELAMAPFGAEPDDDGDDDNDDNDDDYYYESKTDRHVMIPREFCGINYVMAVAHYIFDAQIESQTVATMYPKATQILLQFAEHIEWQTKTLQSQLRRSWAHELRTEENARMKWASIRADEKQRALMQEHHLRQCLDRAQQQIQELRQHLETEEQQQQALLRAKISFQQQLLQSEHQFHQCLDREHQYTRELCQHLETEQHQQLRQQEQREQQHTEELRRQLETERHEQQALLREKISFQQQQQLLLTEVEHLKGRHLNQLPESEFMQLWATMRNANTAVQQHCVELMQRNKCVICLERSRCVLAIPCHHHFGCEECAMSASVQDCPVCMQPIQKKLRVYNP